MSEPDASRSFSAGGILVAINPDRLDGEIKYQNCLAMRELYRDGCRRFRTVRLPNTGDYDKWAVLGWKDRKAS